MGMNPEERDPTPTLQARRIAMLSLLVRSLFILDGTLLLDTAVGPSAT